MWRRECLLVVQSRWPARSAAALTVQVESTSAQVSCGAALTENTALTHDLTCAADGLSIAADNVKLDGAGHVIRGPGTPVGTGVLAFHASGVTSAY